MDMARVKITKADGQVFEVSDLSFEQIKELVGVNGQSASGAKATVQRFPRTNEPDYIGLKQSLSEKARAFLKLLRENPSGVLREELADKLGFHSGAQIGGMTGGGLAKNAEKFHVELADVYTVEVTRQSGERVVLYKPGKEIAKLQ
jgi:hypothetical protein